MKNLLMSLVLLTLVSFCSAEVSIGDIITGGEDVVIREATDITTVEASNGVGADVTAITVQSTGDIILGTSNGVIIKYDKTLTLQKNYVGGFGGEITSLDIMSNDNVVAGVAAGHGTVWVLDKDSLLNVTNQSWLGGNEVLAPVYAAVYGDDKVVVIGKLNQLLAFRDTDVTQVDSAMDTGGSNPQSFTLYGGYGTGVAVQSTGEFVVSSLGVSGKVWRFSSTGAYMAERGYMGSASTADTMFVDVFSDDRVATISSFTGSLFNLPANISSYGTNVGGNLQVGDVTAMAVTNDDKVIIATQYGSTAVVGSLFIVAVDPTDQSMSIEQEIFQTLTPIYAVDAWEPPFETCEDIWAAGLGNTADFNMDCTVDLQDFAILADEWMTNYMP